MVSHQGVLIQDISSPREITARSMYLPYFSGLRQSEHPCGNAPCLFRGTCRCPHRHVALLQRTSRKSILPCQRGSSRSFRYRNVQGDAYLQRNDV